MKVYVLCGGELGTSDREWSLSERGRRVSGMLEGQVIKKCLNFFGTHDSFVIALTESIVFLCLSLFSLLLTAVTLW